MQIAGKSRRIVETDQTRFGQISRTFRQAVAGNPVFRRIEARFGIADVLADQAGAVEAHMADGYVRFPAMQVAEFVCGDDHDRNLRGFRSDALDDLGKNIGRKGISGGDADPPANLLYPTAGSQSDEIRRVTHDADMTEQVHPGLCQHQLAAQPFKQGHAQIGLERQNLPRQCGLRQTKLACRSRQGSGSGGRVKCANMIPVNRIHAFLYIMPTDFDNFLLLRIC